MISFIKKLRQPVSGLTHLVGGLLSIAGLIWLLHIAATRGTAMHIFSFAVFGGSMTMLYTASTLYHLLPLSEVGIRRMRRLDHSMIYLFIAGCYTPICLIPLRQHGGWPVFFVIWSLAGIGIAIKLLWISASRWITILCYLLMGWLLVVVAPQMFRAFPPAGLVWIAAGGLAYTLGALVYALKRPDPYPEVFGFHEIWHIFVMIGSFCHFWAMKQYIFANGS